MRDKKREVKARKMELEIWETKCSALHQKIKSETKKGNPTDEIEARLAALLPEAEADKIFKEIRAELTSLLDNTIKCQEQPHDHNTWLDYAAGLLLSIETLSASADEMDRVGVIGAEQWREEAYDALTKN